MCRRGSAAGGAVRQATRIGAVGVHAVRSRGRPSNRWRRRCGRGRGAVHSRLPSRPLCRRPRSMVRTSARPCRQRGRSPVARACRDRPPGRPRSRRTSVPVRVDVAHGLRLLWKAVGGFRLKTSVRTAGFILGGASASRIPTRARSRIARRLRARAHRASRARPLPTERRSGRCRDAPTRCACPATRAGFAQRQPRATPGEGMWLLTTESPTREGVAR